jgi:hypothetical protein
MNTQRPVVVYGASGYTGRLVCEYLREYNVPFIAAGRDAARVQAVMDKIPGIETADYEVVGVEHDVKALTALFQGAQVVCNMVGPFADYGPAAVQAALAAGCHYVDTTGEQNWMRQAQAEWGAAFAAKGLLLAPSIAQMYTTGEIAANLCLETPGLHTLDILVLWKGLPTQASTQTIFSTLTADWYYLEDKQYKPWSVSTTFEVPVPGQHQMAIVTPWSGTAHPVWFKDDPRVANCVALGGVFAREVMQGVKATVAMFETEIRPLPMAEQQARVKAIAASVQSGMPPRENPRVNVSLDSVHASGPAGNAHCLIRGVCNYKQTGLLQAYAAYHLLQAPPKRVGFASGCQAFGHRELLGQLQAFGLIQPPVLTVNGIVRQTQSR